MYFLVYKTPRPFPSVRKTDREVLFGEVVGVLHRQVPSPTSGVLFFHNGRTAKVKEAQWLSVRWCIRRQRGMEHIFDIFRIIQWREPRTHELRFQLKVISQAEYETHKEMGVFRDMPKNWLVSVWPAVSY